MRHLGILAHSAEGAALCFRAFGQEGVRRLGPDDHSDVTMDCIALARSMPAWDSGTTTRSGRRCRSAWSGSPALARTSSPAPTTPVTVTRPTPARPCVGLPERVSVTTRLRSDAALYAPPGPRRPGQRGRPRVKGDRLPELGVPPGGGRRGYAAIVDGRSG
jgi:hypothetical protein